MSSFECGIYDDISRDVMYKSYPEICELAYMAPKTRGGVSSVVQEVGGHTSQMFLHKRHLR